MRTVMIYKVNTDLNDPVSTMWINGLYRLRGIIAKTKYERKLIMKSRDFLVGPNVSVTNQSQKSMTS
jgi:hypothetical protein